jgi:hypothetical protein
LVNCKNNPCKVGPQQLRQINNVGQVQYGNSLKPLNISGYPPRIFKEINSLRNRQPTCRKQLLHRCGKCSDAGCSLLPSGKFQRQEPSSADSVPPNSQLFIRVMAAVEDSPMLSGRSRRPPKEIVPSESRPAGCLHPGEFP